MRELAELTYRLAANDIVVSSLHADWSHFGSWVLETQRGIDALRFCWDGREESLSVDASPTGIYSLPNEWKNECNKGFDNPDDELLRFVEDYLIKRFAQ